MSVSNGPSIVTSGLVLSLDAADRNSYPGSGTTWTDLSGGGYSASLENGPTFSSNNGGYILLDGTNDAIYSASTGWFSSTTAITLSTWYMILATPSNFSQVFGGYTAVGAIYIGTNRAVFPQFQYTTAGLRNVAGYVVALNTWYNSTATWSSGDTIKHYVNGVFINQSSIITDTLIPSAGYVSGFYTSGTYLNARIAQNSIYNRALSASEIAQNYSATKTRFGL